MTWCTARVLEQGAKEGRSSRELVGLKDNIGAHLNLIKVAAALRQRNRQIRTMMRAESWLAKLDESICTKTAPVELG